MQSYKDNIAETFQLRHRKLVESLHAYEPSVKTDLENDSYHSSKELWYNLKILICILTIKQRLEILRTQKLYSLYSLPSNFFWTKAIIGVCN